MDTWKWFVYIIECLDGSYYTGMTWSLSNRCDQHLDGNGSEYTKKHGFKAMVYTEEHEDLNQARARELQIKNWSRVKKQKLISGEWDKWE